MKAGAISNFWNGLSNLQKLIVMIIVIIVLWYVITKAKAFIRVETSRVKAKSELQALKEKGIKPSYDWEDYQRFADVLEDSMDGGGTGPMTLKTLSYLNNDADFIELYKAFGFRQEADLKAWIEGDLSSEEITMVNNQFRMKGMSKRF